MSAEVPREAIILAAGVGSRLGARTGGGPKCLVYVAGATILERQVNALGAAGVERLVVVTGHLSDQVREAVSSYAGVLKVEFVHNPAYERTNVLHSWRLGADLLSASHYYLHADTVFEPELLTRLRNESSTPIVLAVDTHACDAEAMKVRVESGRIVEISKTMAPASALGEFTGVMRVGAEALPALRDEADVLLGGEHGRTMFVEAALQRLLDSDPALTSWRDVSDLRWREIDFPEDLDAAERLFRDTDYVSTAGEL